jgi:hypothetical protein
MQFKAINDKKHAFFYLRFHIAPKPSNSTIALRLSVMAYENPTNGE